MSCLSAKLNQHSLLGIISHGIPLTFLFLPGCQFTVLPGCGNPYKKGSVVLRYKVFTLALDFLRRDFFSYSSIILMGKIILKKEAPWELSGSTKWNVCWTLYLIMHYDQYNKWTNHSFFKKKCCIGTDSSKWNDTLSYLMTFFWKKISFVLKTQIG